jgi:hypothetical protein
MATWSDKLGEEQGVIAVPERCVNNDIAFAHFAAYELMRKAND